MSGFSNTFAGGIRLSATAPINWGNGVVVLTPDATYLNMVGGLWPRVNNTTAQGSVFVSQQSDGSGYAVSFGIRAAASRGFIGSSNATPIDISTNAVARLKVEAAGGVAVTNTFSTSAGTVAVVNGLNSNITTPASAYVRLTGPTAALSVGGFTGGVDGMRLTIYNTVAFAMTIVNEDASSTAGNRIKTLSGANVTLRAGTSAASLVYDSTESRWILVSTN